MFSGHRGTALALAGCFGLVVIKDEENHSCLTHGCFQTELVLRVEMARLEN